MSNIDAELHALTTSLQMAPLLASVKQYRDDLLALGLSSVAVDQVVVDFLANIHRQMFTPPKASRG